MTPLNLHEELLLLALVDAKGTTASGAWYQQAIAGALVAELLMSDFIQLEGEGKKAVIQVVGETAPEDALLAECWTRIRDAKKPSTAIIWVSKFAAIKKLKHRVAEPLVEEGILSMDERKVLFLFTQKIYPELDGRPEEAIWKRLEDAIFTDMEEVDARTAVLLSIADASGILKVGFDRKELKASKERIAQVIAGDKAGDATRQVVQAAATAAVMAAVMPAMISATIVTSS